MNATDYLSVDSYLILPTKSKPRVYLSIDTSPKALQAFRLYNPFSRKARFLKAVMRFLFVQCNPLAKLIIPTQNVGKSDFMVFLEKQVGHELTSSLYLATEKDKVVLQLQRNGGIIGYLKYALTPLGVNRLSNEQRAIEILAKRNLIPSVEHTGIYNGKPFLLLKNLEGSIGAVSKQEYLTILDRFKKGRFFELVGHPRILDLKMRLQDSRLKHYGVLLDTVSKTSKNRYQEVFEHGDFAPWNLIRTANGIVPFDFEYFEESGLEFLDEIKYHFQIESLLNKKRGEELLKALYSKVKISEQNIIIKIFLIKEILRLTIEKKASVVEQNLLDILIDI